MGVLRLNISGNPGRICSGRVPWDFPGCSAPGLSVLGRNLAFPWEREGPAPGSPAVDPFGSSRDGGMCWSIPNSSERHHCTLAITVWPQVGAVTQIPLNVIARRALILPSMPGANSLPRAAPGRSDLPRDGCRVGLWLCHCFGTNPWELQVSTSPWPWDPGSLWALIAPRDQWKIFHCAFCLCWKSSREVIKHKAISGAGRFIPAAQGEKPFCAGYK